MISKFFLVIIINKMMLSNDKFQTSNKTPNKKINILIPL
jgi:hypothetical protein